MKVSLITLGCPKNLVDAEIILGYLGTANYAITTDWENSDVCIINTCAFLKAATKEAEQWIRKIVKYKQQGFIKKIIVAGCLCQRNQNQLLQKYPLLDGLIGIDNLADITRVIRTPKRIAKINPKPNQLFNYQTPRLLSTHHYAYIKIADGCDNFCSYCLIPSLRGRFRSRPIKDIVKEAELLTQSGVKEIILIAQDTTQYGKDINQRLSLAKLLKYLVKIKEIEWIRVLYTHPAHWSDELISVYQENPKICRYVDLPLQHISDSILKTMNRPYNRKQVEQLLSKLKKIPNLAIRSSFIVGFPGETENDFKELLDFIKEQKFAHLGAFAYSRESGTLAYHLPNQIPSRIKQERLHQLMTTQQQISLVRMKSLIGKRLPVIIDQMLLYKKYRYLARSEFDAPEIDGVVYLADGQYQIGDIVKVKITDAESYALFAS